MSDNHSVTDATQNREADPARTDQHPPMGHRSLLATAATLLCLLAILFSLWKIGGNVKELAGTSQQQQFWLLCHAGATDPERKAAFMELVKSGNIEWRSANLRNLDLSDLDFPSIQVQNANFENSSLAGANLPDSELSLSLFQLVDFTEANVSSSNLIEVYLLKAILNKTNFYNTNLQRAMIEQATAHGTNFEKADLTEAHMLLSDFKNCNFRQADMTLVNLEAATLEGCDLTGAQLEKALLLDADFTDSNWWRAQGLTTNTIEDLLRSFPPSETIKPEWKADFKEWLIEFTSLQDNSRETKPRP